MSEKLRVILTGATGMVGEGVLIECLKSPLVESVLLVNRKPSLFIHPKLKEIAHQDFFNLSSIENELSGYNTCLFCLGVSSVGMNEDDYTKVTYTLTMNFARTVSRLNPNMSFSYISGASTDSTEKGRMMWARVKGKTENDLMKLPFKAVYAFRPGMLKPSQGQKNTLKYYKYLGWLYPILKLIVPNSASSLQELGLAMINASANGSEKKILEVKDIIQLAK
jgi:uncharacterized protein YbjT (DUF2867 family)